HCLTQRQPTGVTWMGATAGPEDELAGDLFRRGAVGGFLGRRAHRLLYFIEGQAAYRREQATWACQVLLGSAEPEWKARDLLEDFALRDVSRPHVTVHELERYAPEWGRLVPESPTLRAAVARALGQKYSLGGTPVPKIRDALALDSLAVQDAYRQEYGESLDGLLERVDASGPPPDVANTTTELLATAADWVFAPGGSDVVRQGESMEAVYVVSSGRLRAVEPTGGAVRREYATGDVLGDMSVLTGDHGAQRCALFGTLSSSALARPRWTGSGTSTPVAPWSSRGRS
ncbi:MAG: cyclic nucleotide-binding domain-containing protein, partial [Clostridia bacterium]